MEQPVRRIERRVQELVDGPQPTIMPPDMPMRMKTLRTDN